MISERNAFRELLYGKTTHYPSILRKTLDKIFDTNSAMSSPGFLHSACKFQIIGICFCVVLSCSTGEQKKIESSSHQAGEALAKKHCASCHLFPEPTLLDKETWTNHTLPAMGYRFGIYSDRSRNSLLEKGVARRIVETANIFPIEQIITDAEWESITRYYRDQAPETLIQTVPGAQIGRTARFSAVATSFNIRQPAITALAYDERKRQLYVADCSLENQSSVTVLDASFKPITTLGLAHPISNLSLVRDTLYLLSMGHFVPSDEPSGQLLRAVKNTSGEYVGYQRILKNLKRPVDVAYGDLNGDDQDEIVVCEFGNHTGSVSLFIKKGKSFTKEVLLNAPGACKVMLSDMNKDNQEDVVVLMSQGDEGIDIYFNQGSFKFKRVRVLRFPPVFGSASFCLNDFNNDGYLDMVYVNGDNADASRVLKPYHGIRIFINNQHNAFTQSYFFPMHGAYQAAASDFNMDGKIDIAAISFFADFIHHPEQGFVYLENVSSSDNIAFTPSVATESKGGRWLVMTSNDFDQDGFDDVMLGSFTSMLISGDTTNKIRNQFIDKSMPLLLLKNSAVRLND